jgi:hypothetical protein
MASKAASVKAPRLPKKEMLAWLKNRTAWNHQEWLGLLADLKSKGFGYYTDSEEGRAVIGQYLEENRGK